MTLTLHELTAMPSRDLFAVLEDGHRLDEDAMADTQYLGVALGMPKLATKLLWQTFRKTFYLDGRVLRGWNVRMEQTGIDGRAVPMTDRQGKQRTFGHYHVRSAEGISFPRGFRGAHYLDYSVGENASLDLARFGATPLVAVNEGSSDLLLGWEVFRLGSFFLPLPIYYALEKQGPLAQIVRAPRASR